MSRAGRHRVRAGRYALIGLLLVDIAPVVAADEDLALQVHEEERGHVHHLPGVVVRRVGEDGAHEARA